MVAKKLRLAKLFRCNNVGVRRSMQGLEECRKDDARGLEVGTAEEQAARRVLILQLCDTTGPGLENAPNILTTLMPPLG